MLMFKHSFRYHQRRFNRLVKQIKNDYCRDQQAKGYWLYMHKTTDIILVDVSALRVNPYSAGIDFSRQNLTSVDVRF